MEKLLKIQQELKAPKNLYNDFGKYSYRSAESILEALKPLLEKTKTIILITDEMCYIGERYYIKALVRLYDMETQKVIAETSAFAREEENKKGMDGSQITGASSSYARKYALNGMFLIDDVKDSDATNNHRKEEKQPISKKADITNEYKCKVCGKAISKGMFEAWDGYCAECKTKKANEDNKNE